MVQAGRRLSGSAAGAACSAAIARARRRDQADACGATGSEVKPRPVLVQIAPTKRPPEGGRVAYCLVVSSVFLADAFFAFLGFFFMVSLLLIVSPLAAGVVDVWAKAVDETNAVDEIKARAVVAMISLRMRRPPLFFSPAPHHNGTTSASVQLQRSVIREGTLPSRRHFCGRPEPAPERPESYEVDLAG